MTGGAGRARRILALAASTAAVALALGLLPSAAAPTAAAPAQDCIPPNTTDCTVPTDVSTTTTTEAPTSSTSFESTTTEATTTTVRRSTTTTRGQATSSTLATSTSGDVLVPGDGTEGAELTTTTELTATRISNGGPSDGTLIALVVLGLVVIAAVVAVLTWRYWVATRPPLLDDEARPHDAR